jgi:hypothetical protein
MYAFTKTTMDIAPDKVAVGRLVFDTGGSEY